MRLFFIILIFFCAFAQNINAQYIEPEVLKKTMLIWQKKAQDTIKIRRAESNKIRSAMSANVKVLGYDEIFIFGPNNAFIKEDMNLLFARAPQAFGVGLERAPKQDELERNHVKLYWADVSLYRWKKIGGIMDSLLKKDTVPVEWTSYKEDEESITKLTKKEAQKISDERIAKSLYRSLQKFFPQGNTLLKETPKKNEKKDKKDEYTLQSTDNQYIVSSFPYLGQFNYYLDERINKEGYVIFNQKFKDSIVGNLSYESAYKMVWSDGKNFEYSENVTLQNSWKETKVDFKIPEKLEAGKIYQMCLFAIANEQKKAIWTNYIRTSKYGLVEKIKKIGKVASLYNLKTGSIKLTIDEPFDYYEITARNERQKLCQFTTSKAYEQEVDRVLKNKEIYAYLTIPNITAVDTSDLNNIPLAEKDHTANAPFIRKINLGNLEASPVYSFQDAQYNTYRIDTFRLGKLVIIPAQFKERDTVIGDFIAPFVTAQDFKNGKIKLPKKYNVEIFADHLKSQNTIRELLKNSITERMTERANFFYLLAVRDWKREKLAQKPNYQQFVKEEKENMTNHLKFIINDELFNFRKEVKINIVKSDYTERTMAIWDIVTKKAE